MKNYLFAFISFFMFACNVSLDSRWDIDVLVPIASTELTISDIVADSVLHVNEDHSVELHITSSDLKFSFDTIAAINETTTVDFFTIPFSTLDFEPGSSFPTPLDETVLDIDDTELTEMRVKSGKLGLKVTSYIQERLLANFSVLSASLDGTTLNISREFEPAEGDTPSTHYEEIDISGYTLDLTGIDGNEFNKLISSLSVVTDPEGSAVTVTNTDSLVVEVSYLNIQTAYAKGYFGEQELNMNNENFDISFLNNIEPGQFNAQNMVLKMNLINGVGTDLRLRLDELISLNEGQNSEVELMHEIIGNTINLDRATDNNGLQATQIEYVLDGSNSNIDQWIENAPSKVNYSLYAQLNPLGNVSGGNDFIYCESELGFDISLQIPLCFSSDELQFSDTLAIDIDEEENVDAVRDGDLKVYIKNTFPLEGSIQIYMLQNGVKVDSIFNETFLEGQSQNFPSNGIAETVLVAPLSAEKFEKLKASESVIVSTTLFTVDNEIVKIFDDQKIDVKVVLDANYLIDTQ